MAKGENAMKNPISRYKVEGYRKQRANEQHEARGEFLRLRLLADEEAAQLGKRPRWRHLKTRLKRIAGSSLTTDK